MIATGGGRYDPQDTRRYFLASSLDGALLASSIHDHILVAVNDLSTDKDMDDLEAVADRGTRILLDSGIFNLAMNHARAHNVSHDIALNLAPDEIDGFDNLYAKYVAIVDRLADKLWGYIELDQGGRVNKIKTRTILEGLGMKPIPVYHPFGDGWEYFDELASGYDRICLGNIVRAPSPVRLRLIATMCERKRQYPNLWIHGLGLSISQFHNAFPLSSCDSSSWTESIRWVQGYRERSAGGMLSEMPQGYRYERANADSLAKATAKAAYGARGYELNWRGLTDEFAGWGIT